MKKLSFFFIFCLLLASCEKHPDELTVTLNQSGTVSVKVTDGNQIIKEASVSIYSTGESMERIYYGVTDANGMCHIGKVLQSQYGYSVSAKKDNKTYTIRGAFQVIAGEHKTITANPCSNVGNAKIKITNNSSTPIVNINVALIPHSSYSNANFSFQALISEAYSVEKTNSEGWVEFQNMPAGQEYSVLVYYDNLTYDYPTSNNYMYISQGATLSHVIKANL